MVLSRFYGWSGGRFGKKNISEMNSSRGESGLKVIHRIELIRLIDHLIHLFWLKIDQ